MIRPIFLIQLVASFIIVALGHPSFLPWLAPFAAGLGYALFWNVVFPIPFFRWRFISGLIWYAAVQSVQLCWMTSIEYQGVYILCVYGVICLCLGIQFGLLTAWLPRSKELSVFRILALTSFWVLLEWARYYVLCGFSWNPSGTALTSYLWPLQMSVLFGVLGLSFWVMFSNFMALRAWNKRSISYGSMWLLIALFPYLFGWLHLNYHLEKQKDNTQTLQVALVQTGLLPSQKIPLSGLKHHFIAPDEQWKRILTLLSPIKTPLDFIVLPEAALPFTSHLKIYPAAHVMRTFSEIFGYSSLEIINQGKSLKEVNELNRVSNQFWAQGIADLFNAEVVLGLDHKDQVHHSSAFHVTPHQMNQNRYDKRILMPLAEYLPFEWLRPFVKAYGIHEFFTPGTETKIFYGKVPFSISICYEETFPYLMRQARVKGAQLFINLSNDGWYPHSQLSKQHFDHAKIRAVENGVPLIRSCNTGITAAIDSLGHTIAQLDELDAQGNSLSGVVTAKVNTYQYFTLYTLWGDIAILILCSGCLILFFSLKRYFSW